MAREKSAGGTVHPIPKCSFGGFPPGIVFACRPAPGDWLAEAMNSGIPSPGAADLLPIRQGRPPPQEAAFFVPPSREQATYA